jgi:hypothetical protein
LNGYACAHEVDSVSHRYPEILVSKEDPVILETHVLSKNMRIKAGKIIKAQGEGEDDRREYKNEKN